MLTRTVLSFVVQLVNRTRDGCCQQPTHRSPGSRVLSLHACSGSLTPSCPNVSRLDDAFDIAFRSQHCVGTRDRCPVAGKGAELNGWPVCTLLWRHPRRCCHQRTTRGQSDWLSFLCRTLASPIPSRFIPALSCPRFLCHRFLLSSQRRR